MTYVALGLAGFFVGRVALRAVARLWIRRHIVRLVDEAGSLTRIEVTDQIKQDQINRLEGQVRLLQSLLLEYSPCDGCKGTGFIPPLTAKIQPADPTQISRTCDRCWRGDLKLQREVHR